MAAAAVHDPHQAPLRAARAARTDPKGDVPGGRVTDVAGCNRRGKVLYRAAAHAPLGRKRRSKGSRVQGGEVKARLRVISREIDAPWVELVLRPCLNPCLRATGVGVQEHTAASSATRRASPATDSRG